MARGVSPAPGNSLKDQLFNVDRVRYLAGLFGSFPDFDRIRFETSVMACLQDLELKARINWIARCLLTELPVDLPDAAPVLRGALPPPLDPKKTDNDFGEFILAPLGEVVVHLGLERHPALALDLLAEFTMRFSMELAMRPFLARWPELTLARLANWVDHENYHVRRLVSESSRPRLPWGCAIALDPLTPLPLLDRLHADRTRYVTRSVANHLNDVARTNPDAVLERLCNWQKEARQRRRELDWMTQHALRGLVRAGDARALTMIGLDTSAAVRLVKFQVPSRVAIGGVLAFSVMLEADTKCSVLVDYVFRRRTAKGQLGSRVFRLRRVDICPGQPVCLEKAHRLKGDATTYRLYPGLQRIELRVNGKVAGEAEVLLV